MTDEEELEALKWVKGVGDRKIEAPYKAPAGYLPLWGKGFVRHRSKDARLDLTDSGRKRLRCLGG